MLIGRGKKLPTKNGSVANESKNRTVASLYAEERTFGGDIGAGNGRYGRRGRKLLGGTAVGEETARRFIYYFGADNAAEYIDWAAIGKQNPLAGKDNETKIGGNNE